MVADILNSARYDIFAPSAQSMCDILEIMGIICESETAVQLVAGQSSILGAKRSNEFERDAQRLPRAEADMCSLS